MALYISASRRMRRTVLIALAVGVAAFVIGWLFGRQQVPSIDDRVAEVEHDAGDAATGLERLGIEYEQVLAGTDDLDESVLTPIDDLRSDLQRTMDRAPWVTSDERATVLDAVAAVRQAALDNATLDDFTSQATAAAAEIRTTFGTG